MCNPGNPALMLFIQERSQQRADLDHPENRLHPQEALILGTNMNVCIYALLPIPQGILFWQGLSSEATPQDIHSSNLRKKYEGKENTSCLVLGEASVLYKTLLLLPTTLFPPYLLRKSLTVSTAVLIFILFIIIVSVQDRPIRVRISSPVFPLAFVLWGTEGF